MECGYYVQHFNAVSRLFCNNIIIDKTKFQLASNVVFQFVGAYNDGIVLEANVEPIEKTL